MRCKEAYVCLLSAQSPDRLPLALQKHLQRCDQCRQRRRRLCTLEAKFQSVPPPAVPGAARAAILQKLAEDAPEQSAVVVLPLPEQIPQRRPLLLAAAAVALLALGVGLGWGLARFGAPAPSVPVAPAGGPREATVGRILDSDLRLAAAVTAPEQLAALADIAGELSAEALRLAHEGPAADVLLVSELYERVVWQGLVKRAQSLPADAQEELLPPLTAQLAETARAADGAPALAGAAPGLRVLANAAREAGRSLSAQTPPPEPRAPAWQPARTGLLRDLLGAVVVEGLRLAEADDPLRRADCCTAVAEHLVQGILLAAADGDADRSECLGGFLGSVMDRGVAVNLERFHATEPPALRRAEAEQIGGRSAQAMEVLQRNLAQAPPAAQAGLEKALNASKKDKEPKGKAKGQRPDKPIPPGQLKKQQREKE